MSKTIAMTIKCCHDCPFSGSIPLIGVIAEALSDKNDPLALAKAGTCSFDRDSGRMVRVRVGLVGPERDAMLKETAKIRPVKDRNTIPDDCPLRVSDVVVTLGS